MLGIGVLGLIGGALLGLFVQDLLATAFARKGNVPSALSVVFVYLIPVVSIVTAVAAIVIDRGSSVHRTDEEAHDD